MRLKKRYARKYCRSVRSFLPCSIKQRRLILSEIKSNVSAYLEDNPSADSAEIENRFGQPGHIATAYVDEMGTEELLKQLRIRKKIITVICACAALALLIWASVVTIAFIENQKSDNGYYDIIIH